MEHIDSGTKPINRKLSEEIEKYKKWADAKGHHSTLGGFYWKEYLKRKQRLDLYEIASEVGSLESVLSICSLERTLKDDGGTQDLELRKPFENERKEFYLIRKDWSKEHPKLSNSPDKTTTYTISEFGITKRSERKSSRSSITTSSEKKPIQDDEITHVREMLLTLAEKKLTDSTGLASNSFTYQHLPHLFPQVWDKVQYLDSSPIIAFK